LHAGDYGSPEPTRESPQALTAQAIAKINEAIKLVGVPNDETEVYFEYFGEIKNSLQQANQELKLANTKTKPNIGE
jgi:hypothetical protein